MSHVDAQYPSLAEVQSTLPKPALIEVRPGLQLETLHVDGPPPTLVFLHGGLGNLWDAYLQLYHFHRQRELVTYSLAGNGRSDDRDAHSLQGHVRDLADLLRTIELERPILVAWSYGVALALEYAKQHPVRAMMLTGGAAYRMTPAWEYPFLRMTMALRLYRVIPGGWIMQPLARLAAFHPDTPDELVREMLRANPLPRRRSAWQTVTNAFWGYDGRDGLQQIRCPVFVAHGPADRIVPIDRARETAELLPEGRFFRLEKSGHAAPVERAERYNQLLERLIAVSGDSQ